MNNLIISWKELAQEKYGSIAAGIRHLNKICNTKVTPSCVNSMSKGEKAIPASINRCMLLDVLPDQFKKAKFKASDLDLGKLFINICIPERINK